MEKAEKIEFPVESPCNYYNQTVVGGFKPAIKDLFRMNSPHGLSFSSAYLFGTFRDEEDGIYVYMRNIGIESSPVVYLFHNTPEKKIICPEVASLFRGMILNRLRENEIRIRSWRGIPGPGLNCILTTENMHLVEEGAIELFANRVGIGVDIYFPHRGEDIYYRSVLYEAEGIILGKKVKGGLSWDQVYGASGASWQADMRPYQSVEKAFVTGINIYDNGDKEMYHVAAGKGYWGWLFASVGNEVTAISHSVKAKATQIGEHGVPTQILFRSDGGDWQWTAHPYGNFTHEAYKLPVVWVEGETVRVGETRIPISSMGWIDIFPERLI